MVMVCVRVPTPHPKKKEKNNKIPELIIASTDSPTKLQRIPSAKYVCEALRLLSSTPVDPIFSGIPEIVSDNLEKMSQIL